MGIYPLNKVYDQKFASKNWMKNLFHIFLILCFCFSNYACTTNSNTSDGGILFYREKYGEWGWHEDGDELKDSRKYEGDIRKGEPHGRGKLIQYNFPKESVISFSYVGVLDTSQLSVLASTAIFGAFIWLILNLDRDIKLHAIYEGDWKRGEKHGQGTYFFPNRDRYEGDWKRGEIHGQGTYYFSGGDKYVGEWRDGKKHGQGTYFFSEGDRFEGNWEYDEVHGKGTYVYPGGERFSGEWKDGNKHKHGRLIFPK